MTLPFPMPPVALLPLLSFGLTALGLYALLRTGLARRLALDEPNARSLHVRPTPRIGGLVLVPAALAGWSLSGATPSAAAASIAALCLLSYLDDRAHLPVALRLAAHCAIGAAFIGLAVEEPELPWLPVAVAVMVVLTNLYNFMDGADGLAGGMALLGFSAYAWAAAPGDSGLAVACACLAAAAAGFLLFNFPPARIFMGDAGSIPLGFAAVAIGFLGVQAALWPIWFPFLVFSPFWVDAGFTLLRRVLRGERFWQAHRQHYYQRLIRMGWSHRRTAVCAYALMFCVAASAVLGLRLAAAGRLGLLLGWGIVYALLLVAIDARWRASMQSAEA